MVRFKERYLLVQIIYPPDVTQKSNPHVPDLVLQHQPTTDNLTIQALLKGLRNEIAALFGDYGLGAVEANLSGKYWHSPALINTSH